MTVIKTYDFCEMLDKVNQSLGFDIRDCGENFYPNTTSFEKWHKSKKYPEIDPEGRKMSSSYIWSKEYDSEVDSGVINKVPYLDFGLWQTNRCFKYTFRNDSENVLYVGVDEKIIGEMTFWQKEIQSEFHKLFYPLSKNGWIDVKISW